MHDQAGTVIGGSQLSSGPHEPASISRRRLGRSAAKRSKTRAGAAQSKPMIAKRFIAKNDCQGDARRASRNSVIFAEFPLPAFKAQRPGSRGAEMRLGIIWRPAALKSWQCDPKVGGGATFR